MMLIIGFATLIFGGFLMLSGDKFSRTAGFVFLCLSAASFFSFGLGRTAPVSRLDHGTLYRIEYVEARAANNGYEALVRRVSDGKLVFIKVSNQSMPTVGQLYVANGFLSSEPFSKAPEK